MCVLKYDFFAEKKTEKNHKNHFKKISSILDMEASILDTVKTFEISAFENIDDRYSQTWS